MDATMETYWKAINTLSFNLIMNLTWENIPNGSVSCLKSKLLSHGAKEFPYRKAIFDPDFPQYDNGYSFQFFVDNDIHVNYEILEKNGEILQGGFSAAYVPAFFSNKKHNKHFEIVKALTDGYYGIATRTLLTIGICYKYDNIKTNAYIAKLKENGYQYIAFRVGDNRFWKSNK